MKPYSRRQFTREEGIANYKMREEGSGECIWNPCKQIQGLTGHDGAKATGCQRHCFDMCCVAQHTEDQEKAAMIPTF